MSVLTREKIIECMKNGQITITPQIDDSQIGCASVDLTLSNEFRFYKPGLEVLDVDEQVDYRTITEKIVLKEGEKYLLLPNCACLAITKETISLTGDLCGLLEGRSRFARLGLFVHITAGFMNPGISNRQVLEIFNASNHPLYLKPGVRICQFVFLRTDGSAVYKGRFAKQDEL